MARIVVTGGSGFVGSHICDALIARGDEVVAVDNLVDGSAAEPRAPGRAPGVQLRARRRVAKSFRSRDASTASCTSRAPRARPNTSPSRSRRSTSSSLGTRRALDLALEHNARFLLASTSEIYGDPDVHPQVESYNGNVDPNAPRAVYDEAKRFAETLVSTYRRLYDLPTGDRAHLQHVRAAPAPRRRSRRLELSRAGDRQQAVDDVRHRNPDAVVLLRGRRGARDHRAVRLRRRRPGEHRQSRTRSRCSNWSTSIREVTGSSSEVVFESLPIGDPTRRRPDITRARTLLGWEPKIALSDGLARTRDWYLEERGHGRA